MPWNYLLGSATGAGICLIIAVLVGKKLMESKIDDIFKSKIEILKNDLMKDLETSKSELGVWSELRGNVIREIWAYNEQLIQKMSAVIVGAQEIIYDKKRPEKEKFTFDTPKFNDLVHEYRKFIHEHFLFLDIEKALPITQEFLNLGYKHLDQHGKVSMTWKTGFDYENELKGCRNDYQKYIVDYFGMKKIMPWMAAK